ncbi:MAG: DUF1638 domain-containing protein [Euryarchaeota archaeon]|nr:DUF1638 domain-containing protein [Euryarchaeota archaeon]
MPVLSIIACCMLEDELVHVLSEDSELGQLILVENRECFGLQRKLKNRNCPPALSPLDRIPEFLNGEKDFLLPAILKPFCGFKCVEKIHSKLQIQHDMKVTVVANVLRLGLHKDIELLRSEVYRNIREMSSFSDGILIFYGTCGRSLINTEKDFEALECPLYFLKDDKGEIVEDCISTVLGGNDVYARTLANGTGTFYLTPMWASNWKKMRDETMSFTSDLDGNYLKRYDRVARINTGLACDTDFDDNIREFARFYNMNIVELKGRAIISEQSYQNAKNGVVERASLKIICRSNVSTFERWDTTDVPNG